MKMAIWHITTHLVVEDHKLLCLPYTILMNSSCEDSPSAKWM